MVNPICEAKSDWAQGVLAFQARGALSPDSLSGVRSGHWKGSSLPSIPGQDEGLDVYLRFVRNLHRLYPEAGR